MAMQSISQAASLNPHDLISINNDQLRTTSLKVAEVFGKRHDDVLRKLKGLDCSKEFNDRNFAAVEYLDAKREKRPSYEMTKDGFMFLVMGFTGKKAAAIKEGYINAFNWMAEQLKKQSKPNPFLGDPLLNNEVMDQINRSAQMLAGRTYTHYRNRLIQESLKVFPERSDEVVALAERVWRNEQLRDEIDGIPVEMLKQAYELLVRRVSMMRLRESDDGAYAMQAMRQRIAELEWAQRLGS